MDKRVLISVPPPTPNGGFHLGHMSGPYLAADLYKRYLEINDFKVTMTLSCDENQTYVDTTAKRLQVEPKKLIAYAKQEIEDSINTYNLGFERVEELNDEYDEFVKDFFSKLLDKGLLKIQKVPVLVNDNGEYLVESYVNGKCKHCNEDSCGGICESCGMPNQGFDLLDIDMSNLKVVERDRLVLDLDLYKQNVLDNINNMDIRPSLKQLVNKLQQSSLGLYPLTYELGRGIKTGINKIESQVFNVWAEMYAGHIFFNRRYNHYKKHVQFIGFDNSFFYCVIHKVLEHLAGIAGIPVNIVDNIYTSQFLNLENRKFSTSKGHLIWANDFSKDYDSDYIRLYLSSIHPEMSENNFSIEDFNKFEKHYKHKINMVSNILKNSFLEINVELNGVIKESEFSILGLFNEFNDVLNQVINKADNKSMERFMSLLYIFMPNKHNELKIKRT